MSPKISNLFSELRLKLKNSFINTIHNYQSRFNERKYWKRRFYCQNHKMTLRKLVYLMLLRRVENKQCADTGLGLNTEYSPMCNIASPLHLPHRLNGIIIGRNVKIGSNVTIYQNVTIAECDPNSKTIIGDNVMIGAGAVIIKNVTIGKNAKIGANAVIVSDIPRGGVAVGNPARIVNKS